MSQYAVYEVVGHSNYRGHDRGTRFIARLDRNAERRAVQRGDIRFLEHITPALQPGSFQFPDGWLASHIAPDHQRRRKAPLSLRKE